MKKILTILLVCLAAMASVFAQGEMESNRKPAAAPAPVVDEYAGQVKTGLAVIASNAKSKSATEKADGQGRAEITFAAVTVDAEGRVESCVLDALQGIVKFSKEGKLTTEKNAEVLSKNELKEGYGMLKVSKIGKEWYQQAEALSQYVVGLTADEIKAVTSASASRNGVDLASSATIGYSDLLEVIVKAIDNAEYAGAKSGDKLYLESTLSYAKSKDATSKADGQTQSYAYMSAITVDGDVISSMVIDSVQATVKFNAKGEITSDVNAPVQTKNELKDAYGMLKVSKIGKEWYQQAASFCEYAKGKTVAEVASLAVDASGKAADADLVSSVTVGIADFTGMVAKIGK
ncbi:MAG: hypothetical protein ACI4NM_12175 [Bullifex sp.]